MTLVDEVAARADRERAEWEALLRRRSLGPRVRERLEMVKAASLGQGVPAIVRWAGRSEPTVRLWLGRYRDGGAAGQGRRGVPGGPGGRGRDGAAGARPAV